MAGIPLSVTSEKCFGVYLLLSVRFYFIYLLCLIFCTGLFFIFIFIFFLSCLHSAWLSKDVSYMSGGEGPPLARKKVLDRVVVTKDLEPSDLFLGVRSYYRFFSF